MNISVGVEITNLMGTALDRFTTEDPQTTKLLEVKMSHDVSLTNWARE